MKNSILPAAFIGLSLVGGWLVIDQPLVTLALLFIIVILARLVQYVSATLDLLQALSVRENKRDAKILKRLMDVEEQTEKIKR